MRASLKFRNAKRGMKLYLYGLTPMYSRVYMWRFHHLMNDLAFLGRTTSNMSKADVFLIPNQLPGTDDSKVEAMITHIRAINPRFTWSNHFLLSPCDHGPRDCMFTRHPHTLSEIHPSSPARRLRMLMVTGSRSHAAFRADLDIRIPVHLRDINRDWNGLSARPAFSRNITFFWAGSVRHKGIRDDLIREHGKTPGFFVRNALQSGRVDYHDVMRRSIFCGSPPGWDEGDSDRYLTALYHQCIPVFLLDDEVLPFETELLWEKAALRLRRRDVADLARILSAIPTERVVEMREHGRRVLKRLLYRSGTPSATHHLRYPGAAASLIRVLQRERRSNPNNRV